MDPISVVGLAASLVTIVDMVAKSINSLHTLRTKYSTADLTIRLLIGQLGTLKAALNQISEWITSSLVDVPRHEQLVLDLMNSIEGCEVLLSLLNDNISSLRKNENLSVLVKARLVRRENILHEYLSLLDNQVNALNLFLTALQCRSISEQNRLLQSDESRHIFQQVEDDKSSLLWLRDKDSCRTAVHSLVSESSDLSDLDFDFDREVFNSRAYRTAARANMREALSRTKKGKTVQREGSSLDDSVEDVESGCSIEPEDDVQTVIAEPEDSWPLKDGILVGIVTEISQPDPIICEDNVTNYGIERPISPSYDNGRKRGGAEPGPSISRKKPLPELPSSLNHMPPSAATEDSSQASSKISKNETQRQHEYVTNPSVLDHAPNTPRQPFFQRRDSLLSHFGRKKSDMPKLSNSRFSFLSGLLQQPRTSQVPSAGINKSHLATYKVLEESKKCPKVLILGTSGAGKSTLLKKMTMFAGGTHSIFQREDYRETIQNILGTWNRTTGITENILVLNEIAYRIYDVGGHKAERRKWIHCYENVEIIIFCVDISGYDSCVPEDEYVNNMQDALHLFDDICNLGQLDKTSVILLFTKIDLLQRKLASSPINSCFPDFDGDLTSLEEAKAYFASRFLSLNQNPEKKIEVYFDNIVSNPSAGKLAFAVLETCLKLRKIDEDFRSIHEYIRTKKIIDARI